MITQCKMWDMAGLKYESIAAGQLIIWISIFLSRCSMGYFKGINIMFQIMHKSHPDSAFDGNYQENEEKYMEDGITANNLLPIFQFLLELIYLHLQLDQLVRDRVRDVNMVHERLVRNALVLDPHDPARNADDR